MIFWVKIRDLFKVCSKELRKREERLKDKILSLHLMSQEVLPPNS
jgi:hypothetical protein